MSVLSSNQVPMTFSRHVLRFLGITKFQTSPHGAHATPAEALPGSAYHRAVVEYAGADPGRRHAPELMVQGIATLMVESKPDTSLSRGW
ncbi:hypothetical protein CBM2589_A90408 [Cupriavidus taiwanensis]|uniref:Uncharacterized protein n=1 Tax=Cupriavidus taiwanensis TaxID=164546 RepID=A0A375CFA3_9BURK|nr:hypothetical protein CBM2589_A90408 [Cupriavidus taiwanensis]